MTPNARRSHVAFRRDWQPRAPAAALAGLLLAGCTELLGDFAQSTVAIVEGGALDGSTADGTGALVDSPSGADADRRMDASERPEAGFMEGGADGAGHGLALGARCDADGGGTTCDSGYCVDGVCCEGSCAGLCEACDVGSGGKCTPIVSGQPHGGRAACAGTGTTCGGACAAGSTAGCTYPGSSTSCRGASCAGGMATEAAGCDGSGACPAATTVPCTPSACNAAGTACLGACSTDADCTAMGLPYCNGGACLATKANGEMCAASSECTSKNCVDGYCCNSACTGTCQACDVPASPGARAARRRRPATRPAWRTPTARRPITARPRARASPGRRRVRRATARPVRTARRPDAASARPPVDARTATAATRPAADSASRAPSLARWARARRRGQARQAAGARRAPTATERRRRASRVRP